MKIISYNINGIRASAKLGLLEWLKEEDADIICLQEVRADEEICKSVLSPLNSYNIYYNCGNRKGYSGTILMSKIAPNKVFYGLDDKIDDEGRLITAYYDNFVLLNCYVPNGNSRLEFKLEYLKTLTNKMIDLSKNTNVILCSDTNIAHNEIDVNKPQILCKNSGFLLEERIFLDKLVNNSFIDTFRHLNKNKVQYTWRSYSARDKSLSYGWRYRFDYIFVDNKLTQKLTTCASPDLIYSDHLPVILNLE
ncbi:MAG: exodeoxyribonuclease III [Spirochaetales bacterium]